MAGVPVLTGRGAVPAFALDLATPKRGGTLRAGLSGGSSSDTLDAHQPVSNLDNARVLQLYDPQAEEDYVATRGILAGNTRVLDTPAAASSAESAILEAMLNQASQEGGNRKRQIRHSELLYLSGCEATHYLCGEASLASSFGFLCGRS